MTKSERSDKAFNERIRRLEHEAMAEPDPWRRGLLLQTAAFRRALHLQFKAARQHLRKRATERRKGKAGIRRAGRKT